MPGHLGTTTFALFPFLKTNGPTEIGNITFRSTDDSSGLTNEEADHLATIAAMLFLKDDLQIQSATYAAVPYIELDSPTGDWSALKRIRTVIAYCYAVPHRLFGNPFLSYEHASLVLLSPAKISTYFARPIHHVQSVKDNVIHAKNKFEELDGYYGLYNFQHHFGVVKGSRIYPPVPDIPLNISQSFANDCNEFAASQGYGRVLQLAVRKPNQSTERILNAIEWFNDANSVDASDRYSILNLAVAFEALLNLSNGRNITDRLTDAVSLLLGRVPRLDDWVRQFYDARSEIVHQGNTASVRFALGDPRKGTEASLYRPLLSYGYQIFQLCVATLLTGSELAAKVGLEEKFVSNEERFQQVCKILQEESKPPAERLTDIIEIVEAVVRNQFFEESGLRIKTMLGSVRATAKVLLSSDDGLDPQLKQVLEGILKAKKSPDGYEELDALRAHHDLIPNVIPSGNPGRTAGLVMLDVVWRLTFRHYYWVKEARVKKSV